jgi:hypothetical protein
LDVKESVSDEVIGRFAEWFVERKFAGRGYKIIGRGGGCDFKINVGGEVICIEVKGRRKKLEEITDVELTEQETIAAFNLRDRYWLILVEDIPNNPRSWLLKDPISSIGKIKVLGEHIRKYGELFDE